MFISLWNYYQRTLGLHSDVFILKLFLVLKILLILLIRFFKNKFLILLNILRHSKIIINLLILVIILIIIILIRQLIIIIILLFRFINLSLINRIYQTFIISIINLIGFRIIKVLQLFTKLLVLLKSIVNLRNHYLGCFSWHVFHDWLLIKSFAEILLQSLWYLTHLNL